MRFVILVEGDTEHKVIGEFLKRWLDDRLPERFSVDPVIVHEPGKLIRRAKLYLDGQDDNLIGVIGLLDLHGLKLDIIADKCETAEARIKIATKYIQDQVKHPNFRMFFAVHEIEAWLFSQPEMFQDQQIRKALGKKPPEEVNIITPPAKLLGELFYKYMRTHYQKRKHGINLFLRLDPNAAYQKCPNLKKMLDTMLEMAQKALE